MESLNKTAQFINKLKPGKAYILTPVRPPAENWVKAPSEFSLGTAYRIFNSYGINTEFLVSEEGKNFTYSSDVENELLSILAVHPMKKIAVAEFLEKANSNWDLVNSLIENEQLKMIEYSGTTYIVKNERR